MSYNLKKPQTTVNTNAYQSTFVKTPINSYCFFTTMTYVDCFRNMTLTNIEFINIFWCIASFTWFVRKLNEMILNFKSWLTLICTFAGYDAWWFILYTKKIIHVYLADIVAMVFFSLCLKSNFTTIIWTYHLIQIVIFLLLQSKVIISFNVFI